MLKTTPHLQKPESLFQSLVLVIAACIVHGVMQGVHDNYGIMMTGLIPYTGIDYVTISFAIGVGALVYGLAQPFLGILALRRSPVFVILVGILCCLDALYRQKGNSTRRGRSRREGDFESIPHSPAEICPKRPGLSLNRHRLCDLRL